MKRLLLALALLWPSIACAQVGSTQVAVVPQSGAYSAGQCLGGIQTILALRPGGDGGTILASITIVDPTAANANIDFLFFKTKPAGTYTDGSNCNVSTSPDDRSLLVGSVTGSTGTCIKDQATATGICNLSTTVWINTGSNSTANIFAVMIMRSTPTYGAAKTLFFNYQFLPD